jgi:hypothetical protein
MATENSSSPTGTFDFQGRQLVIAHFSAPQEADRGAAALRAAGFTDEEISVTAGEEEDIALVVNNADRLPEAAGILQQCGGKIGQPDPQLAAESPAVKDADLRGALPTGKLDEPGAGETLGGNPLIPGDNDFGIAGETSGGTPIGGGNY